MRKAMVLLFLPLILVFLIPGTSWSQANFDIKVFPSKLELNAGAGSAQQFLINIQNLGAQDQRLRVYFNDYYVKANNQFVFKEPGHYSYSCAKWLSTDTSKMVAPAGQTVQKAFGLNAEPGGHYGVIFFEQVPPTGGPNIETVPRIGVVTLVTVPGEIVRKGTITSVKVTNAWFWPTRKFPLLPVRKVRCRVTFRNEGNVHLTVAGKVTYTPSFGWGTGGVKINELTILPKTTRYLDAELEDPPLMGSFEATAEVQYGPSLDVYDITKTKKTSFQIYPLSLLLILLLLIALVVLPIWIYRRTQYEWVYLEEEEVGAEQPPEGAPAPEGVTEELTAPTQTVQPTPAVQPEEPVTPVPPPEQPPAP
jgi:hypothetical protein